MKKEFDIHKNLAPSKKPLLPKGYFEQLEEEMLSKTETHVVQEVSMFRKSAFWFGLATAACIGFIVLFTTKAENSTIASQTQTNLTIDQITTQEVEAYLTEEITEVDEELIVEVFEIDHSIQLHTPVLKIDEIDASVIESYLEDYYIYEDEENNTI